MANKAEQTCMECGETLSSKRIDAKYCDDRCRMRYQRYKVRQKLVRELAELCLKVPNHIRKNEAGSVELTMYDKKVGAYQTYDQHTLMRLSMVDLRRFVIQKQKEVALYLLFHGR